MIRRRYAPAYPFLLSVFEKNEKEKKERKINENKLIEACGLSLTQYKAAVSEELSKEQIIEKKKFALCSFPK